MINPYTSDGKTVQGDQLKAITRFEADLDMGQARRLVTLPAKEKKSAFNINEKGEPLVISFAPFLSPEAIKHLQENERYSDQSQNAQLNKLKQFILVAKIYLYQLLLVQEKPL